MDQVQIIPLLVYLGSFLVAVVMAVGFAELVRHIYFSKLEE